MIRYKVLLADDEKQILDGMKNGTDWNAVGYEVVGTALNGLEAWEMIQSLQPDVVISDIRMPFMDGLELAKKIAGRLTRSRMILFSGFDDFDYAQQAIRYQVYDYMLKPVKPEDLQALLLRLHEELDTDIRNAQDAKYLRKVYEENLPLIKEHFFLSLVDGRLSGDAIDYKLQEYGLKFEGAFYAVVIVQTDSLSGEAPDEDYRMQDIYVGKLIEGMLNKVTDCIMFNYYDKMVFLCAYHDRQILNTVLRYLNEVTERGRRFYRRNVYSGVGSGYTEKTMLRESFKEARRALEFSTVSPDTPVNYIMDIEPRQMHMVFEDTRNHQELFDAIQTGREDRIIAEIDRHYNWAVEKKIDMNLYRNHVLAALFFLQNITYQYGLNDEERFSDIMGSMQQVMALQTGGQIRTWMHDYCLQLSRAIMSNRMNANQRLARQAKEFIDSHYTDPELSVEMLCDHLHVSPSHFSTIFSRENGITFVCYLTEQRLKEAKRLLETTDYKTREISAMVGYTEPNYFSYVFKKNMQVSPANYRKQYRREMQG